MIRGPSSQTVTVGSSVVFACKTGGDPIPDVLWRRSAGGGNMPLGRVHILDDRSLRVDNVTTEDSGDYFCEIANIVGSATASAKLVVHCEWKFIDFTLANILTNSISSLPSSPNILCSPEIPTRRARFRSLLRMLSHRFPQTNHVLESRGKSFANFPTLQNE